MATKRKNMYGKKLPLAVHKIDAVLKALAKLVRLV